jgi:hypothetical protein
LKAKDRIPSQAQAKFLARTWSGFMNGDINVGDPDSTTAACIKYGWLVDSGRTGFFPSGAEYNVFVLSVAGEEAIAAYLLDCRYKRMKAA